MSKSAFALCFCFLVAFGLAASLRADPISPAILNPANGHSYILLSRTNWTAAEEQAVALGGHLATVRNQQEQDWIYQTFGFYGNVDRLLWTGLNDVTASGKFVWASGEPFAYANWDTGEPSHANNENFVAMYPPDVTQAGQWNDFTDRINSPAGKPMCGVVEIIPALPNRPPVFTPYTFTTVAGSLTSAGFVDGTNGSARFNGVGLTVDAHGNLYCADVNNHAIRLIRPEGTNWIVTTLAGNGSPGYTNGTGTNVILNQPWDVAVDANTNIYIAGRADRTVRKMTLDTNGNGVVTTLAGVPDVDGFAEGANAKFNNPNGVAVDQDGAVYVSDSVNNRIRRVNPDGSVTTLAGSSLGYADGIGTAANFYYPHALKVDRAGNIFVADTYNHVIRKMTPVGAAPQWHVTTIAGNGLLAGGYADGTNQTARFNRPYGLALDDFGCIYVTDCYENRCLRKITPAGTNWVVTTIGGLPAVRGTMDGTGRNALFNATYNGIAVDAKGTLFVMDQRTIRIGTPTPQIAPFGNQVLVSQPASGYRLEWSPSLGAGAVWNPLTNRTLVDGQFYTTNAVPAGSSGFYRLR